MKLFAAALSCALALSVSAQQERGQGPVEHIRVVAVNPTPEPETAVIKIQIPSRGAVVSGNPLWIQTRVDGYALGVDSQFDRASEVFNSDLGQTLHVVIDNLPYFPINGPSIEPFNEEGFYYDQNYRFEVPFKLKDGFHTIRIFPARSFEESLKGERTYFATYFFMNSRSDDSESSMLQKPYLTYNEPGDLTYLTDDQPILLDFYISNCELSSDGYKVRMTIDGKIQRVFTAWRPYYIYGLKKGKHTMRLQLVDARNKVLPGMFNDVQHTFTIHGK